MTSQSVQYAIRALVNLARLKDGEFKFAEAIAREEKLPYFFLAKILQQLARVGILRSMKGPSGGFALRRPAKEITLWLIIETIDGLAALEPGWTVLDDRLTGQIIRYFERTSIATLARRPVAKAA